MLMGTWFLFSAMGNYVAGWISSLTGSTAKEASKGASNGALDVLATISVYQTIGLVSIGVGLLIFALTPLLKRRMHGVH
jgi:POT family proton-dependent oligopeptide transporter